MNIDYTPAKTAIGYALVNRFNMFSESITHADVYTIKYYLSVLPHEICHVIRLSHPENKYPFYTTMEPFECYIKEYSYVKKYINSTNIEEYPKLGDHVFVFETDDDRVKFKEAQKN